MKEVKVKKSFLINKLTENKEKHRAEFLSAQEVYRDLVIKELDSMLQDARDNKRIRTYIHLDAPQDMTKEYTISLEMLENCVDDEVIITHGEYKNYVLDDWSWSAAVTGTLTHYNSMKK